MHPSCIFLRLTQINEAFPFLCKAIFAVLSLPRSIETEPQTQDKQKSLVLELSW